MVRVTNVRRPPGPPPPAGDTRLFPEEGPADGCASGACLPGDEGPDAPPEPEDDADPAAPAAQPGPLQSTAERWRAALEHVRGLSSRHGASLAFGRLLALKPGEVSLGYLRAAGFHRSSISSPTGKALVEKALGEHFGRPTRLLVQEVADGEGAPLSVAEEEQQQRASHQRSTEGKVRSHPAVLAVLQRLGGEIEHIQVLEPERPRPPVAGAPDEAGDSPDASDEPGSESA